MENLSKEVLLTIINDLNDKLNELKIENIKLSEENMILINSTPSVPQESQSDESTQTEGLQVKPKVVNQKQKSKSKSKSNRG